MMLRPESVDVGVADSISYRISIFAYKAYEGKASQIWANSSASNESVSIYVNWAEPIWNGTGIAGFVPSLTAIDRPEDTTVEHLVFGEQRTLKKPIEVHRDLTTYSYSNYPTSEVVYSFWDWEYILDAFWHLKTGNSISTAVRDGDEIASSRNRIVKVNVDNTKRIISGISVYDSNKNKELIAHHDFEYSSEKGDKMSLSREIIFIPEGIIKVPDSAPGSADLVAPAVANATSFLEVPKFAGGREIFVNYRDVSLYGRQFSLPYKVVARDKARKFSIASIALDQFVEGGPVERTHEKLKLSVAMSRHETRLAELLKEYWLVKTTQIPDEIRTEATGLIDSISVASKQFSDPAMTIRCSRMQVMSMLLAGVDDEKIYEEVVSYRVLLEANALPRVTLESLGELIKLALRWERNKLALSLILPMWRDSLLQENSRSSVVQYIADLLHLGEYWLAFNASSTCVSATNSDSSRAFCLTSMQSISARELARYLSGGDLKSLASMGKFPSTLSSKESADYSAISHITGEQGRRLYNSLASPSTFESSLYSRLK